MDRCRICLEYKRNLCSVFDSEKSLSYADMIKSIAKVNIVEDTDKNKLCLQCRRKLQSLYDFKKQIERADIELNQHIKILKFDNIDEVKVELKEEINSKENTGRADIAVNCISFLQNGTDTLFYKNTTIKKLSTQKNSINYNNKVIPVLDLLNIIKYETDSDYEQLKVFYDDINNSEDKVLREQRKVRKMQRNKMKAAKKKKTYKNLSKLKRVCIKPTVLENIRVIPSRRHKDIKQPKPTQTAPIQREQTSRKRLDMCPYCGIMSANLKSHTLVHNGERKHKCSECNKAFFTKKQLNYHQKNHLMAGSFKCDHCVAVFDNKGSLQSHMVTHTDDKNHICPICNKGFKRRNALLRHKLIHNSSAKSVKCELCNMSFLYKQGLRHHMRVHTGERPFKCEICSQPYSYKHDFNRHCLKKHGVFLKRRSVHVMNEEVLMQERALMKKLMLRIHGVVKEGEPLNPFQGPQAALAFEQALKALGSCEMPIDVML